MSPLQTRAAILGGSVAALLLGALALSDASAALVSPMPGAPAIPAVIAWLAVAAGVVMVLGDLPMPRLVRRLLAIAIFAASAWSLGTIARGLYCTLAFAGGEAVEEEASTWQVFPAQGGGSGERTLAASSFAYRRAVKLRFDEDAVEQVSGRFACLTLMIERNADGVERVAVPEGPIGVGDLEDCPAVQGIGR